MLRPFVRFAALLGFVVISRAAGAATLEHPSFGSMVANSVLIVVAEIVQPGTLFSRARALRTFKGEAPTSDFVIGGFNNACWPLKDQHRQTLHPNGHYLLFLQPAQMDLPASASSTSGSTCSRATPVPKAWRTLPQYAVPTPSMGDYRVDHVSVQSDWNFCSDCSDTLAAPISVVFVVLQGLAQPTDADAMAAARNLLDRELTPELVYRARSDEHARVALSWLLEGQAAFGGESARDALLAAVDANQPSTRVAAVRAMPSLGATSETLQVLDRLLHAQHVPEVSALQVEATRALVKLDPQGKRATNLILDAIATADASESVTREPPSADLSPWVSSRETMIRALTEYRAVQAEPALLALLMREDNGFGSFDALLAHFASFPSSMAREQLVRQYPTVLAEKLARLNQFFIDDGDHTAQTLVFERMLRSNEQVQTAYSTLAYYALHRPSGDARLEQFLLRFLEEHSEENELAELVPLAIATRNPIIIRKLLHLDPAQLSDGDSKVPERVARAMQLKHSLARDAKTRMQEWLQLIVDDRWSGHVTPYLVREVACSTPVELLPTLVRKLEQEELGHLAKRIAVALNFGNGDRSARPRLEFTCFPDGNAVRAPTAAPSTIRSAQAPLSGKGGCGAGCATAPRRDKSGALFAFSLSLLWQRRRKKASGKTRGT